jgi:rfaE bifunctional protein nucleotidyltransferase chain/domain
MKYKTPDFEKKIISPDSLLSQLSRIKKDAPLVFTNGCFDILHRGHVTYLAQARDLGNTMIVALNTDASVKRQNKGEDRPINSLDNRLAVIASLESVSFVTYFDADTPLELIQMIKPDILVKGGDWSIDNIVGHDIVLNKGGSVHSIPFLFATSTTSLIDKIRHE